MEALLSQLLVVLAKSVTVAAPMVGNYPPTNLIVMVMVIVIVIVMVIVMVIIMAMVMAMVTVAPPWLAMIPKPV